MEITVQGDTKPRVVQSPPDFKEALEMDPAARTAYQKMAYSHQREYVRSILEAKRAAARQERIVKAIALLKKSAKAG